MLHYTYFKDIQTVSELRQQYHKLLKQYHPDNDTSNDNLQEITKQINIEYEQLFSKLKDINDAEAQADSKAKQDFTAETDSEIRDILNKIFNLTDLIIDVKGCWIWTSGQTYKHKDILKSLGFKFCKKEGIAYWIWHPVYSTVYHSKKVSMNEINQKYGNTHIETEKQPCFE